MFRNDAALVLERERVPRFLISLGTCAMTPEWILAVTSLAAALFAGFNAFRMNQRAVRRDEVALLREELNAMSERLRQQGREIAALRAENANLHDEVNRLRDKNADHQREIVRLQSERETLKDRVRELERIVGGPFGSVQENVR